MAAAAGGSKCESCAAYGVSLRAPHLFFRAVHLFFEGRACFFGQATCFSGGAEEGRRGLSGACVVRGRIPAAQLPEEEGQTLTVRISSHSVV